jgi:hypothetical protein
MLGHLAAGFVVTRSEARNRSPSPTTRVLVSELRLDHLRCRQRMRSDAARHGIRRASATFAIRSSQVSVAAPESIWVARRAVSSTPTPSPRPSNASPGEPVSRHSAPRRWRRVSLTVPSTRVGEGVDPGNPPNRIGDKYDASTRCRGTSW